MLAEDIQKKLNSAFGGDTPKAQKILEDTLATEKLSARIYRCVIVLAGNSLEKLQEMANEAKEDYRDVISWAEYDKSGERIADYNKPFSN